MSTGTPQLVRRDCWPCQPAQGKVSLLAELPSASKLPLLRCSSAGIRHGNGPDLFWNNRMKWCKGKCYTKERDKLPRAKSARRKRGGTSHRSARWGPKLHAGKLSAGSKAMLARLNEKRWGPSSRWERRGGDPQNRVSPPPPAGRAAQRCSSRLRAPGGFLAVWHHLLGLPGNKAGLAPHSFPFLLPRRCWSLLPRCLPRCPTPFGAVPCGGGRTPRGCWGAKRCPQTPRPALSLCLGEGGLCRGLSPPGCAQPSLALRRGSGGGWRWR